MEKNSQETTNQLRKYVLCQEHFEDDQFTKERLIRNAVPTKFNLVDPKAGHGKKVLRKTPINLPEFLAAEYGSHQILSSRLTDITKSPFERDVIVKKAQRQRNGTKCCVEKCNNNSKYTKKYLFYSFPCAPERQNDWCVNIGRLDLLQKDKAELRQYRVCCRHFLPSCFDESKKLKLDAIPTVLIGKPSLKLTPETKHLNEDNEENESFVFESNENDENVLLTGSGLAGSVDQCSETTKNINTVKKKDRSALKEIPGCKNCKSPPPKLVSVQVQTVESRCKDNETIFISDKLVVRDGTDDNNLIGLSCNDKVTNDNNEVFDEVEATADDIDSNTEENTVEAMIAQDDESIEAEKIIEKFKPKYSFDIASNHIYLVGSPADDLLRKPKLQSSHHLNAKKNRNYVRIHCGMAVKSSITFESKCLQLNFAFSKVKQKRTNEIVEFLDNGLILNQDDNLDDSPRIDGNVVKVEMYDVKKWICPFCLKEKHCVKESALKLHLSNHISHYDGKTNTMYLQISAVSHNSPLRKLLSHHLDYAEKTLITCERVNQNIAVKEMDKQNISNLDLVLGTNYNHKDDFIEIKHVNEINILSGCELVKSDTESPVVLQEINTTKLESDFSMTSFEQNIKSESSEEVFTAIKSNLEKNQHLEETGAKSEKVQENSNLPVTESINNLNDQSVLSSTLIPFKSNLLKENDFEHSCSICMKRFLSSTLLNKHRQKSHVNILTGFSVENKKTLKKRIYKKKGSGFCHICGKKYTLENLKFHLKLHKNEAAFQCNICGKNLKDPSKLRIHKMKHNPSAWPSKHICELCGNIFTSNSDLMKHKLNHEKYEKSEKFPCKMCFRVFYTSGSLAKHQTRTHGYRDHLLEKNKKEPLHHDCKICGKRLSSSQLLKLHTDLKHLGVKRHSCDQCGASFVNRSRLKFHKRIHGEKKFVCEICNKTFPLPYYLNLHMQTHTGERPWPCVVCGLMFKSSKDLFKHYHKHSEQDKEQPQFKHLLNPKTEKTYKLHLSRLNVKQTHLSSLENSHAIPQILEEPFQDNDQSFNQTVYS